MICTTFVSSQPIGWDRATPLGIFAFFGFFTPGQNAVNAVYHGMPT